MLAAVYAHLPQGSTAADAAAFVASNAPLAAALAETKAGIRSALRKAVGNAYGPEIRDIILPLRPRGRPTEYIGPWHGISAPARAEIDDAKILPRPIIESTRDDWTLDRARSVASVLVERYPNPTSAALTITNLKAGLAAIGVDNEIIRACSRPDVTRLHNERIQQARSERVAEGIEVPAPFQSIAALNARIDAYLAGGLTDGQAAADLLVALSARPGEAETLVVGEQGGIRGALKKRGANEEFNLVTAVGVPRATAFLTKWKNSSQVDRRRAMAELGALCREWGVQRRDLRAIGAALAVRAAALAGQAANAGQARDVHRAALRHAEPAAAAAQDHYARVNDPVAQMCARLAELSPARRAAVEALIEELS